jgi:hypothetical protein
MRAVLEMQFASFASLLLLGACTGDGTLVVQVRSDLTPGFEFASVDVVVTADEGGTEERFERAARDDRDWGHGVRVAETSLPAGRYRAVVSAIDQSGATVVDRPVVFELASGEVRVTTVLLTRDCRGVECPASGDDASEVACLAGRCVDPACSEETPELCGAPACASAADCGGDPVASCAMRECTASGACVDRVDHAACGNEALACSATDGCVPAATGALSPPSAAGHVHLTALSDDGFRIFRLELAEGARPQNVSAALEAFLPTTDRTEDRSAGLSPDGEWFSTIASRGGCTNCLVVARLPDLSTAEVFSDVPIAPDGGTQFANGGDVMAYIETGRTGIGIMMREATGWSFRSLTAGAPYTFYKSPRISADGTKVLFVCGHGSTEVGVGICEIDTAGSVTELLPPGYDPEASPDWPNWAADGSLVFQADFGAEFQLWRIPVGSSTPELAFPFFTRETRDPCVLPDGRVATRLFGEIAVIGADGTAVALTVPTNLPADVFSFYLDACAN